MAHSIGSIQEMVRQYKEELFFQTPSNDMPLRLDANYTRTIFKSKNDGVERHSSPNKGCHARIKKLNKDKQYMSCIDSLTDDIFQEKTCTPFRCNMDNFNNFQDLDHCTTNVLQSSQQVIGGEDSKSTIAFVNKSGPLINYMHNLPCIASNGLNPPCSLGTIERLTSDKNQCCSRNIVARNFEEIDQILGKNKSVMEQNPFIDIYNKAFEYTYSKKEIHLAPKELEFEPRQSSYRGAKNSKQDIEAREEAAIKTAKYYLQNCYKDASDQSKKVIKKNSVNVKDDIAINCQYSLNAPNGVIDNDGEANFGEGNLDSYALLELDDELPMFCGNSSPTTSRWQSATNSMETQISTKQNLMDKSRKIKDVFSINSSPSCSPYFGQAMGVSKPNLLDFKNQNSTKKMERRTTYGTLYLEADMQQLSVEDLFFASENPRKFYKSSKALSSKNHVDALCEGEEIYQLEQYMSPRKTLTSLSSIDFESEQGNDTYEDSFDLTSRQALRSLVKFNSIERNTIYHSEPAIQTQYSNTKCRGTKYKGNKSPWMHSLTVRKSAKWHAMSVSHTQLHASAASLKKGIIDVEELDNLTFGCNKLKDTLGRVVANNNFKRRAQEDFARIATISTIPNTNLFIRFNKQTQNPTLASNYVNTLGKKKDDNNQISCEFSTKMGNQTAVGVEQIKETNKPTNQASIHIEASIDHSSTSFLNQFIHRTDGLPYRMYLPKILTLQENCCITNRSLVAKKNPHLVDLPRNYAIMSGLDNLISEVIHEWVNICSTPSSIYSTYNRSHETCTLSPHTTNSTQLEVKTNCIASNNGFSLPEKKLNIIDLIQISNAKKSMANQENLERVQESKSVPKDFDLENGDKRTNIATLASIVQPLLATLQEAQTDESIVKEFEADETVRLLIEKLQLYETKLRVLKNMSQSRT